MKRKKRVSAYPLRERKKESEVAQSCPTLWDPVDHQAPPSMGFSRQESWSVLPCPPPGDLPNPETEPVSHVTWIGRRVLYR